jgi:hypothetical protein
MGLKELFSRWSKSEDARAVARERDSELNPSSRDVNDEDFEGHKDNLSAGSQRTGAAAEAASSGDLADD